MNFKQMRFWTYVGFSVVAILFTLSIVVTTVFLDHEAIFTNQLFGGYESQLISTGDDGDTEYYKTDYENLRDVLDASANVAVASETEGAVLLKNDNNALPLGAGAKISMFSINSTYPVLGNGGAAEIYANGNESDFKDAFEEAGLEINETLYDYYSGQSSYKPDRGYSSHHWLRDLSWNALNTTSKTDSTYGDAAVMVVSRYGAENTDEPAHDGVSRSNSSMTNGDYLQLTPNELSILAGLKAEKDKGTFKSIVVLINSSNPIATNLMYGDEYGVDAALWIGLPGEQGLHGVGQLLTGAATPSGHLTDMWYTDNRFNPAEANFGGNAYENSTAGFWHKYPYVVYQEGIYNGYKYAETRYEDVVMNTTNVGDFDYNEQITAPFGSGLSYTTFSHSGFECNYSSASDTYTVSVTVTNTGDVAGKDVVQIYAQSPYTDYDKTKNIEKSAVELVGFDKTSKLEAGASETLTMEVERRALASYDAYGEGSYIFEAGDYYIAAGADAHDATNNILAAKGYTTADGMDASGNASLVYKDVIDATESTAGTDMYQVANTGVEIENIFDHADPNRNGDANTVEYVTRNDWNGTVRICMDEDHNYTSMEEEIVWTQLIEDGHAQDTSNMVQTDEVEYPVYNVPAGEDGEYLTLITMRVDNDGEKIAFDDPMWDTFLDQLTWNETRDLLSNAFRQTVAIEVIGKPQTIDENGSCGFGRKWFSYDPDGSTSGGGSYIQQQYGLATETDDPLKNEQGTGFTSSDILASTFNTDLAYTFGRMMGEESLWSGMAGLYGYGFNLHRSAYDGRRHEYFSEDAYLTGRIGGYASVGANSKGLFVYNKHFAMHEQETNRFGCSSGGTYEVWVTEQTMREHYLEAWEVALQLVENREMNVMTSFSRIGALWSGNDKGLMTTYLREEAGMVGIAVSDWTESYMAYASGCIAGHDTPDGITTQYDDKSGGYAVSKEDYMSRRATAGIDDSELETDYVDYNSKSTGNYGELAQSMRESAHRVLYTVVHSNAMNGIGASTMIVKLTPAWVTTFNTIEFVMAIAIVVATAAAVATVVLSHLKLGTKSKAGLSE